MTEVDWLILALISIIGILTTQINIPMSSWSLQSQLDKQFIHWSTEVNNNDKH
jgi:hypothetical protein